MQVDLDSYCETLTAGEKFLAEVAFQAASRAGEVVKKGLGSIDHTSLTSKFCAGDLVTEVDKQSQDIIKETILSLTSSSPIPHQFLGEEDIPPGADAATKALSSLESAEHLWIVDPIDGTTNFAHGLPLCAIIIAYASQGMVRFGLIYDPFRPEVFVAWEGKGAYCNGRRLRVCSTPNLAGAMMGTGSPPHSQAWQACQRGLQRLFPLVRSVRILGSAAVMLSSVCCGRLSAFYEPDLNAWDAAAGALLVSEAGGRVTDVWGQPFRLSTRNIVASNGTIHDELLSELMAAEMWI